MRKFNINNTFYPHYCSPELAELFPKFNYRVILKHLKSVDIEFKKLDNGHRNGIYYWPLTDNNHFNWKKFYLKLTKNKKALMVKSETHLIEILSDEDKYKSFVDTIKGLKGERELLEFKTQEIAELEVKKKYIEWSKNLKSYLNSIFYKDRTNQKFILHIGPANSGKTFHALKNLKGVSKGCFLSPLRLLAYEVYEKLNSQGILCSLKTGEERIEINQSTILSATVEMCPTEYMDTMIIDECSMIGDEYRGEKWLKAILKNNAKEVHLILNQESHGLITSIFNKLNISYEEKHYKRLVPLENSKINYQLNNLPNKSVVICFSRLKVLTLKAILQQMGRKCSVIYGSLPPDVKKQEMTRFIDGESDICVSTDAIGMGLNLPCEHVIFYEVQKYDGNEVRPLNSFEVSQIAGRAGRYLQYDKGFYGALKQDESVFLKNRIESNNSFKFKYTYFGLEYEILKNMYNDTLKEKLENYEKLALIPNELGDVVKPQFSKKYLENYHVNLEKIDEELAFNLICCPVKNNNKDYYFECIYRIWQDGEANAPSELKQFEGWKYNVTDIHTLKYAENLLSQIDLYMYLCNNRKLSKLVKVIDYNEAKEFLNGQIMNYLVNEKMGKISHCEDCGNPINIGSRFSICSDCHRNNSW
jgi:ATP-dependent RNA helicase SUPV3L1/SUV3